MQILKFKDLLLFFLFLAFTAPGCIIGGDDDDDDIIDPTTTVITDNINSETTWPDINESPGAIDYCISGKIRISALLTISPGVVIAFESNAELLFTGSSAIIAKGTASEPITFKGKEAIAGFWNGVNVQSTDVRNAFEYCNFSDGGKDVANLTIGIEGSNYDGRASITNSSFTNSEKLGVHIYKKNDNALLAFSNNSFDNNVTGAILLRASSLSSLDNTTDWGTGNSDILVTEDRVESSNEILWNKLKNAHPITIVGPVNLKTGLKIAPGAIIEFSPEGYIHVGWNNNPGYIKAIGTPTEKIIFRGAEALAGFWPGLLIASTDIRNEISHCIISDGGGQELSCCWLPEANIVMSGDPYSSRLKVTNCEIKNSLGCGISNNPPDNAVLTQSNNVFANNAEGDICSD